MSATNRVAAAALLAVGGGIVALWRWHRRRLARLASRDMRVPVTLLTGFLGSGKTTLFNHILSSSHGKKIAIIQNEFGEVGIDDRLMAKHTEYAQTEEIVEVLNGCVCCSVRTDLINVLKKLASRQQSGELCLDAIVIETTGMADPAPVVQTLLVEEDVRAFARIDGVVTLVDAKHIEQHLDERKGDGAVNESVCQVAFADRLLLNKIDLVPDDASLMRIEARLREINPFAPIRRCMRSDVSVDEVLSISGFDLQRTLVHNPGFMDRSRSPTKHDALVSSHSIDQGAPKHLRGVAKGLLDLHLIEEWLGELLEKRGSDLYRVKGVLALSHAEERYVFHAVHMTMDGFFEPWREGESRESKLVFIGKNLDAATLNAGFSGCLDTPQSREARRKALRFAVGDVVQCKAGGGGPWVRCEVVELMYRDASMSPGLVAPYRVRRVKGGELQHVEYDDDEYVRKPGKRGQGSTHAHAHDHSHAGHDHGHVHDENCGHLPGKLRGGGAAAPGTQEHSHQDSDALWSDLLAKV